MIDRCAAVVAMLGLVLLASCGGGGGSGAPAAEELAHFCAAPRIGLDPLSDHQPFPDRPGSLAVERNWVLAHMHEVYLWYDEMPSVDARQYAVPPFASVPQALAAYFAALKTPALTASGKPKDAFSFVRSTAQWRAQSEGGRALGYGLQFLVLSPVPPREAVIAYTEPDSPGADLARGLRIVAIDGVDFVNDATAAGVAALNAGLSPAASGEQHVFRFRPAEGGAAFDVTLTAQDVVQSPVQNLRVIDTPGGRVGYLLFNDHIATAESPLVYAITRLREAGIDDLVLDLRYNGGGFLDLAAELAYMIAGPERTAGQPFQQLRFSDRNPRGAADAVTPFHAQSQGFDPRLPFATPLPSLDLPRVFVLATDATCSASEALVNGLRGVDVQVIQIGGRTCGKPYGFYPTDNCGLTYFAVEFAGTNARNFGDYADGFTPDCAVADDFSRALGDPAEAMLAAALAYRQSGDCPVAMRALRRGAAVAIRAPERENAFRRTTR